MKLRLHKRPHTSWFFQDNDYMRAWLVIFLWLVALGIVAYGAYWLYTIATEPRCTHRRTDRPGPAPCRPAPGGCRRRPDDRARGN